MSITGGTQITTPGISTDEVKSIIGSLSNDIGTLCKFSAGINPWSRWKPIRYNSPADITEAILKQACYGISNIPYFDLPVNMSQFMAGKSVTPTNGAKSDYFQYLPPRGSSYNEPFRIGDFRNYYANAVAPIGQLSGYKINVPLSGDVYISFPLGPDDSANMVTLKDLNIENEVPSTANNTWYFGLGITNGTTNYIMTQSTALSDIYAYGAKLKVPRANLQLSGEWTVYAFLVNGCFSTFQTAPNNRSYYWVPLVFTSKAMIFNIETLDFARTVYGYRGTSTTSRTISYSYSITNKTSSYLTLNSLKISVYNTNGVILGSLTPGSTNISAGQTISNSGTIDLGSSSNVRSATTITLSFTCNSTSFTLTNSITAEPTPYD